MEYSTGHGVAVHSIGYFAGLTFNMDTLYMTWLSMGVVIFFSIFATKKLSLHPCGCQNAFEAIIECLLGQMDMVIGLRGRKLAPFIFTLFLFILISNEIGLIPLFKSPTSDLNTTLSLALIVVVFVQILIIKEKGLTKYIIHFFKPFIFFLPINIIEELAKPITLSFRLFGNIIAGEILLEILKGLVPYFVPTLWLGFSMFVGIIQAFIFTMLTISYLSSAFEKY